MRKFLTTGFLGAILGLLVGAPADASLISRSFLDQALTDYATNTALDLKADKADVTDLSDKIGDAWPYISGMSPGLNNLSWNLYPPEINLENASDLVRFLFGGEIESGINQGGVLTILGESVVNTGAYDINTGQIDEGFRSLLQLTDGWTSTYGRNYLGVKGLNDKIGTLPSGSLLGNGPAMDVLFSFAQNTDTPVFPNSLSDLINQLYVSNERPGVISALIQGFEFEGVSDDVSVVGILPAMELGLSATQAAETAQETATAAKTAADANTAKIGDLPTEIVIGNSNGSIDMFNITKLQSVSLPKDYTLSDFIQDMYYGSFGVNAGLDSSPFYGLSDIIDHVMYGGTIGEATPDLAGTEYKGLIDLTREINKIGDLPTYIPSINIVNYEVEPIEVSELKVKDYFDIIKALLDGDGLENANGSKVIPPYVYIAQQAVKIGTVPDGKNLARMISETETKIGTVPDGKNLAGMIGTLPDGYDSVGAALTAIKGIAEEAKAAAVAAIPDPKTEGSTGKFVLTVDIVGDNATYRWEKIDREGETTTTTE